MVLSGIQQLFIKYCVVLDQYAALHNVDGLTCIMNQHGLEAHLNGHLHACQRNAYPLVLVMMNVD